MMLAVLFNLNWHALAPPQIPWSIVPLVIYCVGSSFAMPSLTIMALDLFPRRKGLASSCQAFVQSGGNALVTATVAPALWGSAFSLALGQSTFLVLGGVSFVVYLYLHNRAERVKTAY